MIRRAVISLILASFTFILFGQNVNTEDVISSMKHNLNTFECKRVSFYFEAKDASSTLIGTQTGVFESQGESFKMTAAELEVFCNGETVWIFDIDNGEVVIMPNDPTKTDIANNPFGILDNIKKNSYPGKIDTSEYEGQMVYKLMLKPKDKDNSTYVSVEIAIHRDTFLPVYILYKSINGQTLFAKVINMIGVNAHPESYFVFNPEVEDDLIITDLR